MSAIEPWRRGGADDLAAEVHVKGHGRVRVAELIGDLAWRQAGVVKASCDCLAEHVRRHP